MPEAFCQIYTKLKVPIPYLEDPDCIT